MQIAVYSRVPSNVDAANLRKLLDEMEAYGVTPVVYKPFYDSEIAQMNKCGVCKTFETAEDLDEQVEFFISMGGDGTILESLCFVKDRDIPVAGINFGRLGFLSETSKNGTGELIRAIIDRTYQVDRRTLIRLDSDRPLFGDIPYGLNEFVILKKDTSAMIKIHTYLNGEFLNTYWADGLIVSTPTGSTAYSLSCGGPIVLPGTANFIITPIAPHNLNVRPIVVPNESVISFEVEGRSDQFLCSLDSRIEIVDNHAQLAVRKEEFTFGLLRHSDHNFLDTLRTKLLWGADKRN